MAKGNWSVGSDYDILIGLCIDDGKRFIDRLYDYSLLTSGVIEQMGENAVGLAGLRKNKEISETTDR